MDKQNKKSMDKKMDSKQNCRDSKEMRKDLGHEMKTDRGMENRK